GALMLLKVDRLPGRKPPALALAVPSLLAPLLGVVALSSLLSPARPLTSRRDEIARRLAAIRAADAAERARGAAPVAPPAGRRPRGPRGGEHPRGPALEDGAPRLADRRGGELLRSRLPRGRGHHPRERRAPFLRRGDAREVQRRLRRLPPPDPLRGDRARQLA